MSQWYAGYRVLGCLLIDNEIHTLRNAFIKKNLDHLKETVSKDIEEIKNEVDCWISCNEDLHENEETGENIIQLNYVSPDQCDGMLLWPASQYNNDHHPYNPTDYRGNNCLIVTAEYQPSTIQQLRKEPFYDSYEELKKEIIAKIGWALPADFPYDERIGDFQYACYA